MSQAPDPRIAYMDGDLAAPRRNGELVFDTPWEGRAFGMAVVLSNQQTYDWEAFRAQLIAEIASAEARQETSSYYERWLRALETVVVERGLVTVADIDQRLRRFETDDRED